jgi:hypothetical protein
MKKVFSIIVLFILAGFISVSGQSNTKGTIQVGFGSGIQFGGAKINYNYQNADYSQSADGTARNLGITTQYAISKRFSARVYLRRELSTYRYPYGVIGYFGNTVNLAVTAFGIDARCYLLNKDKFNLYFAPSIELLKGNSKVDPYGNNKDDMRKAISGLSYTITAGANWYWTKHIGIAANVGYGLTRLDGEYLNGQVKLNVRSSGLYLGFGVVGKF